MSSNYDELGDFTLNRFDPDETIVNMLQTLDEERLELTEGKLKPARGQIPGVRLRCGDFVQACHLQQAFSKHGEKAYLAFSVDQRYGYLFVPLDKRKHPRRPGMLTLLPRRIGTLMKSDGGSPAYDEPMRTHPRRMHR